MTLGTLKDLYLGQLQDLRSANAQALEMTEALATAATNTELKEALDAGVAGIRDGMGTVEDLVRAHGADPAAVFCHGMQGLVTEARAHALEEDIPDPDLRDLMIITQYQRMTHYAIAGYGSALVLARRLELVDEARTLETCLEETRGGDVRMSAIAAA
jgi:ferritin-like metal-binding protein YciE